MEKDKLKKLPKWAQKEIERIEIRGVHLWPQYNYPDPIEIPDNLGYDELVVGWFQNDYTMQATLGCSTKSFHSRSRTDTTTSQGRGTMYATKKQALMAARWDAAKDFARKLHAIDVIIENEDEAMDSEPETDSQGER